jgi:hypothetical protein
MVIGDLNYDILTPDKSQILDDLCDIFDLTNIAKNPGFIKSNFIHNIFKSLTFNVKTSPCWYVGTHESSYAPSVVSTVSPLK